MRGGSGRGSLAARNKNCNTGGGSPTKRRSLQMAKNRRRGSLTPRNGNRKTGRGILAERTSLNR